MKENHSPKFLLQRKMMFALPVLIIPFVTMRFWALGSGQGNGNKNLGENKQGLNLQLPDANLKDDRNADKLTFYNGADADSLKRGEHLRNDPYYNDSLAIMHQSLMPDTGSLLTVVPAYKGLNYSPYKQSADPNEQKIY